MERRQGKIRLSEQELHYLVEEAVKSYLIENEENEGWFGDKWNQAKSAFSTATQDGGEQGMGLKKRFQNAKKNWSTQGQMNDLNNAIEILYKYVHGGKINPNMTVQQLFGVKDKTNGYFGKVLGGQMRAIQSRGGNSYNARSRANIDGQQ